MSLNLGIFITFRDKCRNNSYYILCFNWRKKRWEGFGEFGFGERGGGRLITSISLFSIYFSSLTDFCHVVVINFKGPD
jgi:hypothetical protein